MIAQGWHRGGMGLLYMRLVTGRRGPGASWEELLVRGCLGGQGTGGDPPSLLVGSQLWRLSIPQGNLFCRQEA